MFWKRSPSHPFTPSPCQVLSNTMDLIKLIRPDIASMEPYTPILPFEVLSARLGREPKDIITFPSGTVFVEDIRALHAEGLEMSVGHVAHGIRKGGAFPMHVSIAEMEAVNKRILVALLVDLTGVC